MKKLVEYFFFLFGIFVLALGVNFMISVSKFGLGPWDAFYNGLFHRFGITIGFWIFVANGLFLLFILSVDKKLINAATIISFVLMSVFVDFVYFNRLLQNVILHTNSYLAFVIGALLIGIGLGMYIASEVGYAPHDAFIISLSKSLNISFRKASIIADSSILIVSLLLKGPVSIGTFLMALTTGYTIQFSIKQSKKMIEKSRNTKKKITYKTVKAKI